MSYHCKVPEFLIEFDELTMELLKSRIGMSTQTAELISNELTNMLIENFSGQSPYIPKGQAKIISTRDREIYEKFNGRNHKELAHEYNITVQWVYKIIKRASEDYVKRNQGDLFNETDR